MMFSYGGAVAVVFRWRALLLVLWRWSGGYVLVLVHWWSSGGCVLVDSSWYLTNKQKCTGAYWRHTHQWVHPKIRPERTFSTRETPPLKEASLCVCACARLWPSRWHRVDCFRVTASTASFSVGQWLAGRTPR